MSGMVKKNTLRVQGIFIRLVSLNQFAVADTGLAEIAFPAL
jgi:hypothetical protein